MDPRPDPRRSRPAGDLTRPIVHCALAQARVHPAFGDPDKARPELAAGRVLVAEEGYHRRDLEVAALEAALGPETGASEAPTGG